MDEGVFDQKIKSAIDGHRRKPRAVLLCELIDHGIGADWGVRRGDDLKNTPTDQGEAHAMFRAHGFRQSERRFDAIALRRVNVLMRHGFFI